MTGTTREAVGLLGFVVYSAGLVAFVESVTTGARVIAAIVAFGGVVALGQSWAGMRRDKG